MDSEIDFEKLNKFILAVLYRASLSKMLFFEHITLGPYQDKLREIIEDKIEIDESIAVILKKFNTSINNKVAESFLDPRSIRIDNIKFYQIYLGSGYVIYVKVDKMKLPKSLEKISVGKLSKLHIMAGDFNESEELDIMKKIGENLKSMKIKKEKK